MSAASNMRACARQGPDYSNHGQSWNRAAGRGQEEQDRYSSQGVVELKAEKVNFARVETAALCFLPYSSAASSILAFQGSDIAKVLPPCCEVCSNYFEVCSGAGF